MVDVPMINKWHTVTQMYLKVRHSLLHALSLIQGNSENLEDFSTNYASLHSTYDMLTQSMTKFQENLQRHETRFSKILPFMRNAHQSEANQSNTASLLATLDQKIVHLERAIESLQDKQWQAAFGATSSSVIQSNISSNDVEAKIRDLEAKIQTIQMRIVGNGVQIGGVVFQCFEDVKTGC
jgi:chromosome segregation ATPase